LGIGGRLGSPPVATLFGRAVEEISFGFAAGFGAEAEVVTAGAGPVLEELAATAAGFEASFLSSFFFPKPNIAIA